MATTQNYDEERLLAQGWEELAYGLFIHFGLSTFTGDESGRTPASASQYAPTHLDADQWIRTAHDAGMKYAVLTTKHCTGHCLWPSDATDFDVSTSPVATDVVAEFTAACQRHNIAPGFYYLLGWEMHHQPRMGPHAYVDFCAAQITELLTRYGPITELWLDIPYDLGQQSGPSIQRLYSLAKRLQPKCLVLLNQGLYPGDRFLLADETYQWTPTGSKVLVYPSDLINGERTLPPAGGHNTDMRVEGKRRYVPMETCDTIGGHWFWEPDDAPRSLYLLHRLYNLTRARKANLLLDVPPDRSGRIPQRSVNRLLELRAALDRRSPPTCLSRCRPAVASSVACDEPEHDAGKAVDGELSTHWAANGADTNAWIEVDLGAPRHVGGIFLREAAHRVVGFTVDLQSVSGQWQTVREGDHIGSHGRLLTCVPTEAVRARVRMKSASGPPTLFDLEVFTHEPTWDWEDQCDTESS